MKLSKILMINKQKIFFLILLIIIALIGYTLYEDYYVEALTIEIENEISLSEWRTYYEDLMSEFQEIFDYGKGNRNGGGPQFFKHVIEKSSNKREFEIYNSLYCGVSGSPIMPSEKNSEYIIVKDIDNNEIYGKYYRCCWPCLCDVMKYVLIDKYDISFNDGTCYTYDVLTIEDPCCNESKIPKSVTSYKCSNKKTVNGIHSRNGRLIIALFYDTRIATDNDKKSIQNIIDKCSERMNTEPVNLKGGMGDIFVKLSLVCKDKNNYDSSGHKELKNIYGEPLKPCKTGTDPGSWDSEGYCSEIGGGVHQICMEVTKERSNFSEETGQSKWSEDRVGNNHCMCLGAWALYKAKGKGDGNELLCDSIPEISLNIDYVKNWNTWNGNELPDQIIDGVDSLVQQCYNDDDKKKINKEYLRSKYDNLRKEYVMDWPSIINKNDIH